MKTTLLLLLALAPLVSAQFIEDPFSDKPMKDRNALAQVAKSFSMSKLGKPGAAETRVKFLELWKILQAGADIPTYELSIVNALGSAGPKFLYTADGCQTLHGGGTVVVELKDGKLLEGAWVKVHLKRAGVWDGTTERGGALRHPRYAEVPAKEAVPNKPTKEDFTTRLKEGETFEVKELIQSGCGPCFGKGDMGVLHRHKVCKDCSGSGNMMITWTLTW